MADDKSILGQNNRLAVAGLIVAGSVLRLAGLLTASIWFDEAFALHGAQQPLLTTIQLAMSDYTPPLWDVLVWPWVHIIPGALGLRLPAVLASIAALWVGWLLIQRWVELPAARLAALAALALLPGFVWTAQDGRSYSLLILLYTLSLYYADSDNDLGMWGSCGLLVWCHSVGPILAFTAFALWLAKHNKPRKAILVGTWVGLWYLPYLPTLINRSLDKFPHSGSAGLGTWMGAMWQTLLGGAVNQPLGLWAVGLVLLSLAAGVVLMLRQKRAGYAAIGVLLPITIYFVLAVLGKNVWMYRTIQPIFYILPIWLAAVVWPQKWTWGGAGTVIPIAWGVMVLWGLLLWTPSSRGGELELAASRINAAWRAGDVVYYATGYSAEPMLFYLDKPFALASTELYNPVHRQFYRWPVVPLEQLEYQRAWVIWDDYRLMSDELRAYLHGIVGDRMPVLYVTYMQTESYSIYLVEASK